MPRQVIKSFSLEYVSILDENGNVDPSLDPGISEQMIKEMYHLMVLTRKFDEKLFKLQRGGKIGTYASVKGQEACQIGSAFCLRKTDWFVPAFRELAVFLARGADRAKIVQGWNGDTRSFMTEGKCRDLPVAIPIASQLLHAAGIAWASKIKKEDDVTIVYFGDGATSEGDFHEALNFAGVYKLPVVFFCQNNGWAISTPRSIQTASETIAQKAIAYGINGVQVDGNDLLAVYSVTRDAIERARRGEGPTLIEGMTYRMSDHTTSDDSSKYRNPEEVKRWESKDPIDRLVKYLKNKGWWNDNDARWVDSECEKEVEQAVEKGLSVAPPPPEDLFKYIFKEMPTDLIRQKDELLAEIKAESKGGSQ